MRKRYVVVALGLVVVILSVIGLQQIGNSRTYQFFGQITARANTPEKVVALTFDDGPTVGPTDELLAVLARENVKATFFLTGAELKQNLNEGKKIVAAGHELGNHSYSHQRMLLVSSSFVAEEVESTDKLIREAGYQGQIHFRPPYGKKLFTLPYYLSKTGRMSVTWDVEPETYSSVAADADKIAEHVLARTQPGSIILLHVMYKSRKESLEAVPKIITGLKERGYSFQTVSELLAKSQ